MRKTLAVAIVGLIAGCAFTAFAQQPAAAPRPVPTNVWAPKPAKTPGYLPPAYFSFLAAASWMFRCGWLNSS